VLNAAEGYDVFDFELHAYSAAGHQRFSRLAAAGLAFGAHADYVGREVEDAQAALTETVRDMDESRVRLGLVSGDNARVLEWVEAHPKRFLASFRPDLSATDHAASASEFEQEVDAGRWRAMGELPLPYLGLRLDERSLFPYYKVCERTGIPVSFHTGLDGPDPQRAMFSTFRVELGDPLLLQDVLIEFPRLKIVIFHMGWPFFDHALYMLYAYPNVYLDTGVVNWILGPSLFQRMLREAVETAGSDRILFGSDQMVWPQVIAPATRSIVEADYLSDTDKRRILWDNAAHLVL
jgi:predicted TIM-barrel fold metal-dependent hydrolase